MDLKKLSYDVHLASKAPILYWAKKKFDWDPKGFYQTLLVACADRVYKHSEDHPDKDYAGKVVNKFAWRIGRQCHAKSTIIHTRDGKLIPIEEHPDGWKTFDKKEIFEVKVEGGYAIRCTANHPIMTSSGWVLAENLKKGDLIKVLDYWDKFGDGIVDYSFDKFINHHRTDTISGRLELTNELCELLGWLTSDGMIKRGQSLKFTNNNLNYLHRVEYLVSNNFKDITVTWYPKNKGFDLLFTTKGDKSYKNSFKDFIRIADFDVNKIPRILNYATKTQIASFFRAQFAGDGWVYKKPTGKIEIGLACGNQREYADFFRELLNKFGLHGQIKSEWMKKSTKPFYRIVFLGFQNAERFKKYIGEIPGKPIPEIKYKKKYTPIKQINEIDGEVTNFRRFLNIKSLGEEEVWDVEYPDKGWFFAGGIAVSNSGKSNSQAIIGLYLSFCKPIKTKKKYVIGHSQSAMSSSNPKGKVFETREVIRGAEIIIASADVEKAKTIYDTCEFYLRQNPEYSEAINQGLITFRKNPMEIKFFIEGWQKPATLNFKGPGAKGQSARGKTYDYKIYDEADYIPNAFYEAEKATSINAKENTLTILASTPTGKREHFFKACFTPHMPVILADKSKKKISEIEIGDEVINRWGKIEKVTDVMNRPASAKIIRIQTILDDLLIESTINHRFMAVRKLKHFCNYCNKLIFHANIRCILTHNHPGFEKIKPDYVQAKDLRVGDLLCVPKNYLSKIDKPGIYDFEDFILVPITNVDSPHYTGNVYNLTVGNDHSYLINGFGVANCTVASWGYKEFHFSSWENPNYNKEKDKEMQEELTSSAYDHEIMANWGTVESGAFDWTYFEYVFGQKYRITNNQLSEYRCIRLTAKDVAHLGIKNLGQWLSRRFIQRNPLSKYWFGADLGYSADPSEFMVFEEFNGVMKLILRIHMEHIEYTIQAEVVSLLDTFYMFKHLGIDAGSSGTAVAHILQEKRQGFSKYARHNFSDRLTPIPFGGMLLTGKVNGKEIKKPAKEAMTSMIISNAEKKMLIMPGVDYDAEIENQFRNHTYSIGPTGQIVYSRGTVFPDHTIDGIRCAFYARAIYALKNIKSGSKNPVSSFRASKR